MPITIILNIIFNNYNNYIFSNIICNIIHLSFHSTGPSSTGLRGKIVGVAVIMTDVVFLVIVGVNRIRRMEELGVDGDGLGVIVSLVDAHETICQFEHVIPIVIRSHHIISHCIVHRTIRTYRSEIMMNCAFFVRSLM